MKITAVDERMYHIVEILPDELLTELTSLNWNNISWTKQPMQENYPRRLLDSANSTLVKVSTYFETVTTVVMQELGIKLTYPNTSWWLDDPGFTIDIHTDGHLPSSMQLFWVMPTIEHGTIFYNYKKGDDIRFSPKSIPNTGYIMLNKLNSDGSQPLQWHGMMNSVPIDTIRVCSYTIFGDYEYK